MIFDSCVMSTEEVDVSWAGTFGLEELTGAWNRDGCGLPVVLCGVWRLLCRTVEDKIQLVTLEVHTRSAKVKSNITTNRSNK